MIEDKSAYLKMATLFYLLMLWWKAQMWREKNKLQNRQLYNGAVQYDLQSLTL